MAKNTRKLSPINRCCTLIFPDGTEVNVQDDLRGIRPGHSLLLEGDTYTVQQVHRTIERRTPAHKGGPAAWVRVFVHIQPT